MQFAPHLFGCLGLRGLSVHLRFAAEEIQGVDRFELSARSRERVAGMYEELCGEVASEETAIYGWTEAEAGSQV